MAAGGGRIAALAIGDELLDGRVVDRNAAGLATLLRQRGLSLGRMEVVPDRIDAIVEALSRLSSAHAHVVCSGGLGPTVDDLTREAAAAWLGVELVSSAEARSRIEARFASMGRTMTANNARQALFPRGAEILWNDVGTAPGFMVEAPVGGARVSFLPGVPSEYAWLIERAVLPSLLAATGATEAVARRRLVFFGCGESELEDRMGDLELGPGALIGFRPHFPEIEVTLSAPASGGESADVIVERLRERVVARVGRFVVAEGQETLPERLGRRLMARGERVTTAESCTGGMIAAAITSAAGSSAWFDQAVVTYSNASKVQRVGVAPASLEGFGAVSEAVVLEMASGARQVAGATWALSASGVAGPTGGSPEKPVGTVWVGLAGPSGAEAVKLSLPSSWSRHRIRQATTHHALAWLLRVVEGRDA